MMTHVPELAAGFVRAVNDRNPAGLIALFAEDAVVDDAGREVRVREAIRECAAHDIFGDGEGRRHLRPHWITRPAHHVVSRRERAWEDRQADVRLMTHGSGR